MGKHVGHPAGGGAIDGVHAAERATGDDLLHLAVMDPVTMLMAHHGLDARFANAVAHREQLVARESDGFLQRDQLRAAIEAELDHAEAHVRRGAKAKDVGLRGKRERAGVAAGRHIAQFVQSVLQALRVTAGNAGQFEARIGLEERGVVQAALAHADNEDAVGSIHNICEGPSPTNLLVERDSVES